MPSPHMVSKFFYKYLDFLTIISKKKKKKKRKEKGVDFHVRDWHIKACACFGKLKIFETHSHTFIYVCQDCFWAIMADLSSWHRRWTTEKSNIFTLWPINQKNSDPSSNLMIIFKVDINHENFQSTRDVINDNQIIFISLLKKIEDTWFTMLW